MGSGWPPYSPTLDHDPPLLPVTITSNYSALHFMQWSYFALFQEPVSKP